MRGHICDNGKVKPYEWILCSCCKERHLDFEISEEGFKRLKIEEARIQAEPTKHRGR